MSEPITTANVFSLAPAHVLRHDAHRPRTIQRDNQPAITVATADPVTKIAFSPGGQWVATGGKSVKVWDATSGTLRAQLEHESERINQVAFLDDDHLLLVWSDSVVMLWTPGSDPDIVVSLPDRLIVCAACTPAHALLVGHAAPDGGDLRLMNGREGYEIASFAMPRPPDAVFFTEDGTQLLAFTQAGLLRLWSSVESTSGPEVILSLAGEVVYLGGRGAYLATRARHGSAVQVWNIATKEAETPALNVVHAHSVYFNSDHTLMAITSTRHSAGIELREVATGELLHTVSGGYPAAFNPDSTMLACGTALAGVSGEVQLMQVKPAAKSEVRGQCSQPITLKTSDQVGNLAVLNGHSLPVNCVALSPDARWVFSGSGDRTVRVWNSATGEEVATLRDHEATVTGVALSENGELLVSSSGDRVTDSDTSVRVYTLTAHMDTLDIETQLVFNGHARCVSSVAINPAGTLVASTDVVGRLLVWDIHSGEVRHEIFHAAPVNDVTFSPDGRLVAVAVGGESARGTWDTENSVRLWDVETGGLYAVLKRHKDWVMRAVFSPDGRIAAAIDYRQRLYGWVIDNQQLVLDQPETTAIAITASDDLAAIAHTGSHTIELMNPQTGESRTTLHGHKARINQLAFNHDYTLLASVSDDTAIRLWGIPQAGHEVIVTEHPPDEQIPSPHPPVPPVFTVQLVSLECLRGQERDGDEVYIKVDDRTLWDITQLGLRMSHKSKNASTATAFHFRDGAYLTAEGWQVAADYTRDSLTLTGRTGPVKVQLWEADSFLRGGDDLLGEVVIDGEAAQWDEVECEFDRGGAHYHLTYSVVAEQP